jgi:CRP-like cAMP-binding protein
VFYVLVDGSVSVMRNNRLLNVLCSGDCFGEMAYISDKQMPRSASISANSEITVMKIQPDQLAGLSERCQLHFNQAFMRVLVNRLRTADERISSQIS